MNIENASVYQCNVCGEILVSDTEVAGKPCANCGGNWQPLEGYELIKKPVFEKIEMKAARCRFTPFVDKDLLLHDIPVYLL